MVNARRDEEESEESAGMLGEQFEKNNEQERKRLDQVTVEQGEQTMQRIVGRRWLIGAHHPDCFHGSGR